MENRSNSLHEEILSLTNKIKQLYSNSVNPLPPAFQDLSELQQFSYLKGFWDALQAKPSADSTANSIEQAVREIPTKYTDRILAFLAENGKTYHGNLADALNLTTSGLTAIIKKINNSSIPLIHIEKEGKFKLYTLTTSAQIYVQEKLHKPNSLNPIPEECLHECPEEKLTEEIKQQLYNTAEQHFEKKENSYDHWRLD